MSDSNTPDSTEYLRLIWGEMKSLNGRINTTNDKLDLTRSELKQIREELSAQIHQTNERLDQTREELSERLDRGNERIDFLAENQIRTTTAVVELHKGMGRLADEMHGVKTEVCEMRGELREMKGEIGGLNHRLDNVLLGPMGQQVRSLDDRLHRVEQHLGLSGG